MKKFLFLPAIIVLMLTSCKKENDAHIPPEITFQSGSGYTTGDATINAGDSVLVGVRITKKEDDLRTLNISYAYDGATSSVTFLNYTMTAAEYGGFSHDYWIHARNQPGTEKWTFTVTDRDGNLAQKSLTLTVQ